MPGLPLRTGAESGAGPSEGSEAVRVTQMHEPLISGGTVRKLWVDESELYRQHLLRLDAESRRNRFGGAVSDEYIERYAEPSALRDAVIYGFFVDGVLRGAAELRLLARAGEAEAALSVEPVWQSRGVGTALLERVLLQETARLSTCIYFASPKTGPCRSWRGSSTPSSAFNPAMSWAT
jgi:GNAT superfamily N-acetyltransferase